MAEGLDLGKKVGPLPLGGWVLIGSGVAVGVILLRRKNTDTGPTLEAETGVGRGGSGFEQVSPGGNNNSNVEQTNEMWGKKAIDWLIAQGHDPSTSDAAIRRYISGQSLNIQERALVNLALVQFGSPPKSISGPPTQGPQPVTGLTAVRTSNPDHNEIQINWIPSAGATSYWVTQDSGGDSEASVIAPPKLWWVAPDRNVTFTVVARNDNGDSEARSVTVNSGAPPKKAGGGGGGNPAPQAPPPPPPPPPAARQHTVQTGDTLWAISLRYYGTANRWRDIYNANAGAIEQVARQRGKTSSTGPNGSPGWWIFPGTVLNIP